MSKRSAARSSARGAAKAAGGAHLTRQARMGTLGRLFEHLHRHGFQVAGPASLRERHVRHYVDERRAQGTATRTLQNEAAHIRASLRAVGRSQAAESPTLTNQALGISGSSRAGTKTGATPEQYATALAIASTVDPGLVAILKLERTLGLRGAEAVQAGESLSRRERQLEAGQRVTILRGTKGGRRRESEPSDRAAALEAVREARAVAETRSGRLLDAANLRRAMTWYRNAMHRQIKPGAGITGHCLRYAYAADRIRAYVQDGDTRAEALAHTSVDLGHGDGRGKYVEAVYTK